MKKITIFILALVSFACRAQEVLKQGGEKTSGATTGQVLKWNGTNWVPDTDQTGTPDAYGVLDSAAFRAFNVATAPKYIIMTDPYRGGKFRRNDAATADQYMVFTDAAGRKWERWDYDFVTPEMFGSVGGTAQDSLPLTMAFNWPKKDVILTRPYYSSATLTLAQSKTIYGNHAVIKLKTVLSSSTPNIIINASDVRIVDLTVKGLITTQTGEWSAGIQVSGASNPTNNIILENLNIRDTRGDGIYIASTSLKRGNVNIINVHTNNIMRNGITITAGDNLHINGFTADSVSLIGIDLESDVVTQVARNVVIENIHVPSVAFGTHEDTLHKNITVKNFIIDNSKRGSSVSYVDASVAHKIGIALRGVQNATFENGTIKNTKLQGIFFSANTNRPCKNIEFNNVFMVDNYTTGTDLWVSTENQGERIRFNNCEFKGSSTYPFFSNVDAEWNNCKFINFGTVIVNFGGTFDNCTAILSSRLCYVPSTPLVVKNCTITATEVVVPDGGNPPLSGEIINNTLTLSSFLIGGTLKHNIVTRDNLINGKYFDLVGSGMTIRQSWLVKKTSGTMSITLPQWLGANKEFVLVDSVRNGVTTITGDFVGASSFATDGYSSYRFTYSGNVWHPEISSLNTPLSTIRQEGATTGQAVTWNGSAWAAGNPTASLTNKQVGYGNTSNVLIGNNKLQFDDTNTHLEIGDGSNVEYALKLKRTNSGVTTGEEISLYSNNSPTLQRILGGFSSGELSGTSYAEANPAIDVYVPAARYRMFGRINVAASTTFNSSNVFPILTMMTNTGYAGIGLGYGVDPSTHFHVNGNLRVTGTIKDSNNEDGTSGQVLSTTATGTDWVDDHKGPFTSSGTIPNGVNATAVDDFTITTVDNTGTQSPKFRVVASGTDPGVQVWKVGNDSLQLSFVSGEPTLEAIGTSGDFWINSIGNDIRLGNGSTGLFTHTTKNVLGGYLALPYVQTAANLTVTEATAEVDVVGTSGVITLTFDNTSNLLGSAAKTITVRNRGAFNVTLSRGSQSWQWSDMTGANTASNQTLAPGETAKMFWVDAGVTDYYVLTKVPSTFTGSASNLAISGTSSPLTVTNSNGTGFTVTAGTNIALAGTSGNITINGTASGDITNGGNTGAVTIGTNDNNALNLETNNVTRASFSSGASTGGALTLTDVTPNTNTVEDGLVTRTNSSGIAAASFGGGHLFQGESSTTDNRDMARIAAPWTTATDASREAKLSFQLGNNAGALAEVANINVSGDDVGQLSVGSSTPVTLQPTSLTTGAGFTVGNSSSLLTLGGSTGLVTVNSSASGSALKLNASGNTSYIEVGGTTASTITTGVKSNMDFSQGYTASSGSANFNNILLSGTINQSGTASGEVAGLHINHTITSAINYRGLYIDANGGTNSKGIFQTGSSMTNNFVGNTFFGATTAPTAMLHLGAGTTTLSAFKFTAGTNLTTAQAGAVEWDGTNLFITQTSGPTRKTIAYLANDLSAVEGLSTNGVVVRTATDTWTTRTITAPAAGITVSNGDGVSGNPTLALANDLSAVEGLATNGVAVRTATDTWTTRTLTAGTGISITNGDGISGNPTISSTVGGETIISPSNLTANQNDWNPTSLSTATIIRLTGDSGFRCITGITAPSADKILRLFNVGSNSVGFLKDNTSSSAANRFDFLKDEILLPGEPMEIYYDLTASRWKLVNHQKTPWGKRSRNMVFLPSATGATAAEQWNWASGSGYTTAMIAPGSTGDGRALALSVGTGTTTTGTGYISTKNLSPYVNAKSGQYAYFGTVIYMPISSDGTNTFALEFGLKASATIGTSINGAYFRYTHSENSGNWQCVVTTSGTPSVTNTSVAAASGTYPLLEIFARPNDTVAFYINGVLQASVSYTGTVDLMPINIITKSAGTTNARFETNYIEVESCNK